MNKILILILLLMTTYANAQKTVGQVVRLDPALDALIDKDAKIEVLADGFTWSEGPVWVKNGEYLIFSDVPANIIYKWKESDGLSIFLKPSGYTGRGEYSRESGSNGLTVSIDSQIIACEHGDRRVSIMPTEGGGKKTLADNHEGNKTVHFETRRKRKRESRPNTHCYRRQPTLDVKSRRGRRCRRGRLGRSASLALW